MAIAAVAAVFVLVLRESSLSAESTGPEIDTRRARSYLLKVCRIGPRMSGSAGMRRQQKIIAEHFTKLGGKVRYQSFDVAHPLTGVPVRMANMIVSWHPQAKQRVLVACHYDTRPLPDRDRRNPRGRFIGANDGASGVALLMEMGHHIKSIKPTHGVDFVFFDGEEMVYLDIINRKEVQRGEYFLGSKHFARNYRDSRPSFRYVCGVVVDMIGDRNLNLFMEINSLKYAPQVTKSIWSVAARLKVREFIAKERHEVQDDHLPLNQIAGIPTCDIIDFDYPYWHTTQDIPAKCSAASLAKVGRVLLQWLTEVPDIRRSGRRPGVKRR